jgi:hypothetical protein
MRSSMSGLVCGYCSGEDLSRQDLACLGFSTRPEFRPFWLYNTDPQGLTVSREVSDDPKEKDNETFTKGVTAVGRFGRYVCIRRHPKGSFTGTRTDASVPTKTSELYIVVVVFTEPKQLYFLRSSYQSNPHFSPKGRPSEPAHIFFGPSFHLTRS